DRQKLISHFAGSLHDYDPVAISPDNRFAVIRHWQERDKVQELVCQALNWAGYRVPMPTELSLVIEMSTGNLVNRLPCNPEQFDVDGETVWSSPNRGGMIYQRYPLRKVKPPWLWWITVLLAAVIAQAGLAPLRKHIVRPIVRAK